LRSGHSGIYVTSHEERRALAEITAAAMDAKFGVAVWTLTQGIQKADGSVVPETQDPVAMLDAFYKLPEKTALVCLDFHLFLKECNPMILRALKDKLVKAQSNRKALILLGCAAHMQPEIEKELVVIDFKLPGRDELEDVLHSICSGAKLTKIIKPDDLDALLEAASGLTTTEAANAFALSIAETKEVQPALVRREKANTIRKNGLLEIVESNVKLEDIGGLDNLKADLFDKRNLFGKPAREYGLPAPRGCLFCGQPGSGKSLTAMATKTVFNIPLLRLEAGRLFGSLVGQSEANWRSAFATAKAIAPCVLWIDEVDGLFSGAASSGHTDGGTTSRVIKAILQDMQLNSDGIYFVFTANDIDGLPDPLIDRLDVWSVDLPTLKEREAIWRIQIEKRGRKAKDYPVKDFAAATDGFSGRQIEQLWLKAMTTAFNDKAREPSKKDVTQAASTFVPTSVTMAMQIERRRARLLNRAQPASKPEPKQKEERQVEA
jgi:SpoVK/Ycf46/Vps4 family AAA+-type ATPase